MILIVLLSSSDLVALLSIHFCLCMFNAQIPMLSNKPQGYTECTVETASIPTFADVLWVYEDEGDSFAKTRYSY